MRTHRSKVKMGVCQKLGVGVGMGWGGKWVKKLKYSKYVVFWGIVGVELALLLPSFNWKVLRSFKHGK